VYKGDEIEEQSMSIIESEIGYEHRSRYSEYEWLIVRRVIHATADYDFACSDNALVFTDNAVESALYSIRNRAAIVADTDIIYAALNKSMLSRLSLQCVCRISEEEVIDEAKRLNKTRAQVAMRLSSDYIDGGIVVIGNAPTALYELIEMVREGIRPRFIIALPVGFVSARESKLALIELGKSTPLEYVTNKGRKGGSTAAASILNALFKMYLNK
jgi:precorrin-8X/cobalt-precorrin-8 methylmutase